MPRILPLEEAVNWLVRNRLDPMYMGMNEMMMEDYSHSKNLELLSFIYGVPFAHIEEMYNKGLIVDCL